MYLLTLLITKFINSLITFLKIGSGNTWPGHIALTLNKNILLDKRLVPKKGIIIVTGTNGKTTTVKLISSILEESGNSVLSNISGANLLNGVVTSLLVDVPLFGSSKREYAVFEMDELHMPNALGFIKPICLVLTNLSRDQLDRYGEVDYILNKWKESFVKNNYAGCVFIPSNYLLFKGLYKGPVQEFALDLDLLRFTQLIGSYNACNVNAAFQVCSYLGISKDQVIKGIKDFSPAYGRGETLVYQQKSFDLFLAKNPASMNLNLEMIAEYKLKDSFDSILFILNDNIPDGRDVSWIYDINPESLLHCNGFNIYISGSRAYDMAIRLKYSGVTFSETSIIPDISSCVLALQQTKNVHSVLCLPNYSAMLLLRKALTGRKIL